MAALLFVGGGVHGLVSHRVEMKCHGSGFLRRKTTQSLAAHASQRLEKLLPDTGFSTVPSSSSSSQLERPRKGIWETETWKYSVCTLIPKSQGTFPAIIFSVSWCLIFSL